MSQKRFNAHKVIEKINQEQDLLEILDHSFARQGNFTIANVTVASKSTQLRNGRYIIAADFVAVAKRNPIDKPRPEFGKKLAFNRAVSDAFRHYEESRQATLEQNARWDAADAEMLEDARAEAFGVLNPEVEYGSIPAPAVVR